MNSNWNECYRGPFENFIAKFREKMEKKKKICILNFEQGDSMNGHTAVHIEKHEEWLCN